MRYANLALRFVLELAGLAAFGYAGFAVPDGLALKVLLGLGGPIIAAVLWGVFASPRARVPLPGRAAQIAFESVWFGSAAAALAVAGRAWLGLALVVFFMINRLLMYLWRQ
jgi:Protein of unknown function (DUF2568)